jgi:hypothetical protein
MSRQRPGSVTAAAVLAIIYGGLFTICNLCGVFGLAAQGAGNLFGGGDPQQAQLQKQVEEAMAKDVPVYKPVQIAGLVVGLLSALAFLAAGIGLLGMQSWARLLALAAALFTVFYDIAQSIYQLVFVMPAMNRVFTEVLPNALPKGPAPMPAEFMQIMKASLIAGIVIGVLIQIAVIVYLLIIVFLLMRSNVRAAFAGVEQPEAITRPPDLEDEEGWGSLPPPKPKDDTRIQ